jgi:hypothetical protein
MLITTTGTGPHPAAHSEIVLAALHPSEQARRARAAIFGRSSCAKDAMALSGRSPAGLSRSRGSHQRIQRFPVPSVWGCT